ncbi:NAD(P)H-dependent oxidoreductase [Sinorhizobium garamanticum]|uniref:NAD(P)H-dependent oxidoreductase n=1 Tax=Sinorhizobium garamanticum TaxID=680247 RepID=A0ABY8DB59_9HYPH|nr:NADPH-dependent FMN reductase [Sinorhizobium garamanticum]WEX86942.1 NAD(P)H-dependent oxidoreductase [Sinorhizobium garamanticum]
MTEKMTLAVIYGSARQGRFCDTVASWLMREISTSSVFSLTIIDPVRLRTSRGVEKAVDPAEWMERKVAEADAFIVVTPEYNHGYPAALKELIDSVYEPWHAKPVAFVSYGGASGGIRAVEQLRQVFGELHAVTLRDGISIPKAWSKFDAPGNLYKPDEMRAPLFLMMDRLTWWARTLKTARKATPYNEIAA